MPVIEELIASIEVRGAKRAEHELKGVANASHEIAVGLTAMAAVGGALSFISHIQQVAEVLGNISGVTIAAKFQAIQISLENLTGSAQKAAALMREFRQIGIASPYSTVDVSKVGMQAIGAGVPIADAGRQVKSLMNVAAFGNLEQSDIEPFMRNLFQIKTRGKLEARESDINQMVARSPAVNKLFADTLGLSQADANKKLRGMSGDDVYNTLIRAGEGTARFAAAAQSLRNPVVALSNAIEQFEMIMEPTGKLIIGVLTPIVYAAGVLAGYVGALNNWSHGLVGLGILMVGATYAVGRLSLAIAALAASASVATTTTSAGAVANAITSTSNLGFMATMGAGLGFVKGLSPLVKGGIIGGAVALGGQAVGGAVQGDGSDPESNALGGAIKNMSGWAGAGAGIGMLAGPEGAVIGGVIGFVVGGIVESVKMLMNNSSSDTAQREIAQNTKRTADAVEDLKFNTMGGGKRSRAAFSRFETELAISKALGAAV